MLLVAYMGLCLLLVTQFWMPNALSQEVLAENEFWHEIVTQGHFRVIHFAISHSLTRGRISYIAGLISEVSEKVAIQIAKNCRRWQPHFHLMPHKKEPPRISACSLYFQKLQSLAYIFVSDSMDLPSFKFVQLAPIYAPFLQQSVWPFKVIQGWWFWYQSKVRICDFQSVIVTIYGPILHRF